MVVRNTRTYILAVVTQRYSGNGTLVAFPDSMFISLGWNSGVLAMQSLNINWERLTPILVIGGHGTLSRHGRSVVHVSSCASLDRDHMRHFMCCYDTIDQYTATIYHNDFRVL